MGPHSWPIVVDSSTAEQQVQMDGQPDDYVAAGEKDFRERKCLVLENHQARRRVYVGVDDHRLHGLTLLYIPTKAATDHVLEIADQAAGRTFSSEDEINRWYDGLSVPEKQKYDQRVNEAMFVYAQPLAEHYLDDYREIATGLWFPAKQGFTFFESTEANSSTGGRQIVATHNDWHLVDVKVNEPLDESIFAVEPLKDGIQVYNWSHDLPLIYKHKADRPAEEWQKIR
jgi:hypothetical protein